MQVRGTYTYIHVHVCKYVYIYKYMNVYMYIYVHMCMYTYTYTYIRSYIVSACTHTNTSFKTNQRIVCPAMFLPFCSLATSFFPLHHSYKTINSTKKSILEATHCKTLQRTEACCNSVSLPSPQRLQKFNPWGNTLQDTTGWRPCIGCLQLQKSF